MECETICDQLSHNTFSLVFLFETESPTSHAAEADPPASALPALRLQESAPVPDSLSIVWRFVHTIPIVGTSFLFWPNSIPTYTPPTVSHRVGHW